MSLGGGSALVIARSPVRLILTLIESKIASFAEVGRYARSGFRHTRRCGNPLSVAFRIGSYDWAAFFSFACELHTLLANFTWRSPQCWL
ncbi:hypothetical protein MB02_13130 [Croceicoccus estronivorus]|nr:hypothetical protein MB02_13130 [Croceicoccus estronivorus]